MTWTGARLRDARARRDWTQKELAEHLGASLRSVAAWERDEAKPQAQWATKLDDLFADDTPANRPGRTLADATVLELLAELANRFAQLEAGRTSATRGGPPERLKFFTADAPQTAQPGQDQSDEEGETDRRSL
jgi:transcriptional regulator with XRE-family HTH domain